MFYVETKIGEIICMPPLEFILIIVGVFIGTILYVGLFMWLNERRKKRYAYILSLSKDGLKKYLKYQEDN